MTDPLTGAGSGLRALNQARRLIQDGSNPLVAVKHGRREGRAVVYDRFLSLCISFYRLRREQYVPRDQGGDAAALEEAIPLMVDELYSALYAIELRSPAEVRKAARHLFWRIVGRPLSSDSLYKDWYAEDLDEDALEEAHESHFFGHVPSDELGPPGLLWNDLEESEQLKLLRSWYKPWTWRKSVEELEARRPALHPFWASNMFRHSAEFLDGVAYFSWVARIDVNNRWRWWHWPMALIPPLKRWQLER
ncbi:hypothetical protein [Streptomyces malaysiensis]|uniref:hypothetical protein n=1 Tax=Streptomyces malaysiensis TaxID=92644 RepID=UPI002B305B57|nr:hypothetical protein R8789_18930 [Streptomyces malaysiensis]